MGCLAVAGSGPPPARWASGSGLKCDAEELRAGRYTLPASLASAGHGRSAIPTEEFPDIDVGPASTTQDSKALSTEALGTGSPAIDVVPGSFCPPPATDERGVTRPQGAGCEIGAFEVQVVAVPVPVPTTGAVPAGPVSGLGYVLLVIGGLLGACVVGAPLRRRRHPTH